ncbi:MAG: PHP domain-containing protein, partial [Casimicrobiaceae bacterium]
MSAPRLLPGYAELHCLSNYSFLRGASHPEELVERASAQGYAALALTDECSLAGVVRAHLAAKEAGLALVIGSEFALADGTRLVLLAHDRASYGDLAQLITRGRRHAAKGSYRLTRDDVASTASSCLALWLPQLDPRRAAIAPAPVASDATASDAMASDATASDATASDATASGTVDTGTAMRWTRDVFADHAWIGVELFAQARDCARLAQAQELSQASGLPLVAAGDAHMHVRARRALQDTLTAIRLRVPVAACGHALYPNGERHLRARARLAAVYPPALIAETLTIARRCEFSLDTLRYEYPEEIVPSGETPASWLRRRVEQGLVHRYGGSASGPPSGVRAQVEHELALIAELGYEPYFLTVDEIVAFARSRNILCQGRGSAANS